ncbi:MAG TPA: nucleoside triphosphate pyrophosphohydrolase, partial [Beijerinckiaceae bacterium]|nr:nucleoside triphosphate pyrophosphohydrolase [Beijerinckiaceae bacterium]
MTPSRDIQRLLAIMAALRTPGSGCPWDLEQDFASIAPYTIEEAYEVADAIERADVPDLKEELGDLLLQVVFHARMAEEGRLFDFGDVVEGITAKLVRRHPHVFGEAGDLETDEVNRLWDAIKREEKAQRRQRLGDEAADSGLLAGVPLALPALTRAEKLTRKAATVGFDWPDTAQVVAKIHEELEEVREAAATQSPDRVAEEVGDLLFAAVNVARRLGADPELELRRASQRFVHRVEEAERIAAAEG